MELQIRNVITHTIRKEDSELNLLHDKGIFFLPELAITYLVGKELVKNAEKVFNCSVENWWPETRVAPDFGPVDLVIKLRNNLKFLFEFKVRSNIKTYGDDIEKLLKIKSRLGSESDKYHMYFCGLMDCFAGDEINQNKVIAGIENRFTNQIKRVAEQNHFFDYFTTKDHAVQYMNKTMSCVIGLWSVG